MAMGQEKRCYSGSSFRCYYSEETQVSSSIVCVREIANSRDNWTRNTTRYSDFAANGTEGSSYLSLHCIARYVENVKTK